MPPIEEVDLHQKALLWPMDGSDSYGQPRRGAPVDVPCRWVAKSRQMLDSNGNLVGVDATVVVLLDVNVGSTIWLAPDSTYDASGQWLGTGSGETDAWVMEVIAVENTPDINNRVTRKTLGLSFFRNTLPEQA